MTKLNLAAKGDDQIAVLNYLQQNATDILADKINNGIQIVKTNLTNLQSMLQNSTLRFTRTKTITTLALSWV